MIGLHLAMSLSDNKTGQLWHNFMTRRKEILNTIGTDLYSIQFYNHLYFENLDPDTEFVKWAAIEVNDFRSIPYGMGTLTLPAGQYAVFSYKGAAADGNKIFQHIFGIWLPKSEYILDDRPHFEILGEKYNNADTNSEEEIWIPIKAK